MIFNDRQKALFLTFLLGVIFMVVPLVFMILSSDEKNKTNNITSVVKSVIPTLIPEPTIAITIPNSKVLPGTYHIFQTFNNCGPAAFSMALSYYGINKSQQELGNEIRPYQVANGDNDDKSVTLEELAEKSKEFNLVPFHRPNGTIELIKLFLTYDLPVITRT